jgi:hypothetical protein
MKKIVIVTGILTLSSLLGYFFYQNQSTELTLVEKSDFLQNLAVESGKIWRNADLANDQACKTLKNVDDSYYQCNAEYFQCVLDKNLFSVGFNKRFIKVSSTKKYSPKILSTHKEYLFNLEVDESHHIVMRLKDSCKEAYLPQRYYPFLANQRDVTIEWDNFNKSIFVDRNLVRISEIRDWAKQSNNSSILKRVSKESSESIATNFSIEEMNNYCAFHGKHILSAKVYDAAVLHPEDISSPEVKLFRAPYYPWSRKNSQTEIFKIQKGQKIDLNEDKRSKLCQRVYSQDCMKSSFINYNSLSSTWSGINEALGGVMEFVTNTIHPKENLILSSKYYPWKSKVHRVGVRGFWDGEGYGANNFELGKFAIVKFPEKVEIGFRCMRFK